MGVALALDTKQDLEKLDYSTVGLTEEDKASHVMQLQTLIAYFYLRGLDFLGGLPIFTSTEGENLPRQNDKETFDQVVFGLISDLDIKNTDNKKIIQIKSEIIKRLPRQITSKIKKKRIKLTKTNKNHGRCSMLYF